MLFSRRNILRGVTWATAATALGGVSRSASSAEVHQVVLKHFSLNPRELRIKLGDQVEWINYDGFVHTLVSDDGQHFNTGMFITGETASHTFDATDGDGVIPYHCDIYPAIKGTIIVES